MLLFFQYQVAHVLQQIAGEDKIGETLVVGVHDLAADALPFLMTLVVEDDILANTHHGVHVVGIDDSGHVEFLGDAVQQVVDDE